MKRWLFGPLLVLTAACTEPTAAAQGADADGGAGDTAGAAIADTGLAAGTDTGDDTGTATEDTAPAGHLVIQQPWFSIGADPPPGKHSGGILLHNQSPSPIKVLAVTISPLSKVKTVSASPPAPFEIPEGAKVELILTVVVDKPVSGTLAMLTLHTDDSHAPVRHVEIRAGPPPALWHQPEETLHFPAIPVAGEATATLTLMNPGDKPVPWSGASFLASANGQFSFAPGAELPKPGAPIWLIQGVTRTLPLRFVPKVASAGSTVSGTLILEAGDPKEQFAVALSGKTKPLGCQPMLMPLPQQGDLGTLASQEPKTVDVPVTNTGSGPCTFKSVTAAGCTTKSSQPCGLQVGSPTVTPLPPSAALKTLLPGETAKVSLMLTPPKVAEHHDAVRLYGGLAVRFADQQHGAEVVAGDTGWSVFHVDITPQPPGPAAPWALAVSPTALDFRRTLVGCPAKTRHSWLVRRGYAPALVKKVSASGSCGGVMLSTSPLLSPGFGAYLADPSQLRMTALWTPQGTLKCTMTVETTSNGRCLTATGQQTSQPCATDAMCASKVCKGDSFSVPLSGEATATKAMSETVTLAAKRKHDVLFVVQGGAISTALRAKVAKQVAKMLAVAKTWQADIHIGVTSGRTNPSGTLLTFQGTRIITDKTPNASTLLQGLLTTALDKEPQDQALFAAIRRGLTGPSVVDTGKPCTSAADCGGLLCVADAKGALGCGGVNRGFRREDALLTVILVSVHSDLEQGVPTDATAMMSALNQVPGLYDGVVHAIAVAQAVGSPHSSCLKPIPTHLHALAKATGGFSVDACAKDLSYGLASIGETTFGASRTLHLAGAAETNSVSVTIGGQPCKKGSSGWWHEIDEQRVTFWPDMKCPAKPGDEVKVSYTLACGK